MITIFTPTYNRAYIINKLYMSLCRQSSKEFEWVVVDDGSTDNTKGLFEGWIKDDLINITYIKQENQGKHIAINTGLEHSKGNLFFIVDSDDTLKEQCVELIQSFWDGHKDEKNISGIISYREFNDGRLVGTPMPKGVKRCKLRETSSKYGSYGDKVVIYRREIIKRYPFPKFGTEKFLGESYVYNQIDDEYDMIFLDARLYKFGYQSDGLSQNFRKLYRENPLGFLAIFEQGLKYKNTQKGIIKTTAHILNLSFKTKSYKKLLKHLLTLRGCISFLPSIYLYHKIFIKKKSDVTPYEISSE